jgi:hypothetical protein
MQKTKLPCLVTVYQGQPDTNDISGINNSQGEREGAAGASALAGRGLMAVEGATLPAGGQALAPVNISVSAINSSHGEREGEAPTAPPVEGATIAPLIEKG